MRNWEEWYHMNCWVVSTTQPSQVARSWNVNIESALSPGRMIDRLFCRLKSGLCFKGSRKTITGTLYIITRVIKMIYIYIKITWSLIDIFNCNVLYFGPESADDTLTTVSSSEAKLCLYFMSIIQHTNVNIAKYTYEVILDTVLYTYYRVFIWYVGSTNPKTDRNLVTL